MLKNLIEQRNKLMTDMQALAAGENFTAEKRTQFDTMNADLAIVDADITRLQGLEARAAELAKVVPINRAQPGADLEEGATGDAATQAEERKKKEKRAFEQYIRFGHSGVDQELRSFIQHDTRTTGRRENRDITTTTGATMVPQDFYPVLTDALKYYGPISQIVGQKRTTGGAPLKIALDNDTGNSLTILGETVAVTEVDPTFSGFILSTDTVTTGVVKITLQELQDSYFDLDSWIRTKFGQRLGRGYEAQITNGNGSNVASLIAGATLGATATGNNGTTGATGTGANSIGYDDIVALYTALDPAYIGNATWTMNSLVRGFLLGVKDGFGRPLFIPNPSSGSFDMLLGRPVVLDQAQPNIAASAVGTVLFGDMQQGYLFRTDGDISILRLNERFADTLEVGFIGYSRIGGASMDAGTHPIVKLAQSAS
jgi:HK97 family phage major capsid protein